MKQSCTLRHRLKAGTIVAMLCALLLLGGCSQPAEAPPLGEPEATAPVTETPAPDEASELEIEDLEVGSGAEAASGKSATVHYTGWLTDGTKFDSSLDSGQPFTFAIGAGEVISGWDVGVAGMRVGGKRKLTIPPSMGYGEAGAGGGVIPPGATLIFEVELLEVQ